MRVSHVTNSTTTATATTSVTTHSLHQCRILCTVLLLVAGCGEPVREDRTIEFTRDGAQVAFQHEDRGVYVARDDGTALTQIFQPDERVLATSRPLANPVDGRLIFTTAVARDAESASSSLTVTQAGPADPEGRFVFAAPIEYTCWLREVPRPGEEAPVQSLFRATCDHAGYVAAGLAVRWNPDGRRITFIRALDDQPSRLALFEYDLETRASTRVTPFAGEALVADWSAAGTWLVCVVSDGEAGSAANSATGIWIGHPEQPDGWWRVPGTEALGAPGRGATIEQLRAARLVWSRDEQWFAFTIREPTSANESPRHGLFTGSATRREVAAADRGAAEYQDLHWTPDGNGLLYVERLGASGGPLRIAPLRGEAQSLPVAGTVRRCAGFNSRGARLAWIEVADESAGGVETGWALVLTPDPLARDRVLVADVPARAAGASGPREIFSGMRVTFPAWSPTEDRLSLWLTFVPRYRSILSRVFRWGLWPGDPAATLDLETGDVAWMAVTPQEELQVGHYHLLMRHDEEAWRWYERARARLARRPQPRNWEEFAQRFASHDLSDVYEAHCLERLGRLDEARALFEEFERGFFPPERGAAEPAGDEPGRDFPDELGEHEPLFRRLIHDLFVAEVYLSIDAVDAAHGYFRTRPAAVDPAARLSQAIVESQLLLIARDYERYLVHAGAQLLPAASDYLSNVSQTVGNDPAGAPHVALAGLALAPLFRSDFLERLPPDLIVTERAVWNSLRAGHPVGLVTLACDLFERAAAIRLGDGPAARAAHNLIHANPAATRILGERPIDNFVADLFATLHATATP